MLNNSKQEKIKDTKETYKIKDIFAKKSEINVNEVIKKAFLINLKSGNQEQNYGLQKQIKNRLKI